MLSQKPETLKSSKKGLEPGLAPDRVVGHHYKAHSLFPEFLSSMEIPVEKLFRKSSESLPDC